MVALTPRMGLAGGRHSKLASWLSEQNSLRRILAAGEANTEHKYPKRPSPYPPPTNSGF